MSSKPSDVMVLLSSANFHENFPDFQRCIGQLLVYGAADLKDVIVEFGDNLYALSDDAKSQLDQLASYVVHDKKIRLDLTGHTDSVGGKPYNKMLSERRVHAVEKHLLDKGVARNQVNVQGFGDAYPTASNVTEEGRSMNRRVLVAVVR